ncbi:MAG: molybdopterin-dependent oxidoreductase, partial [Chloroflexi bacterium]|nr:molybdopterin-dependent oxidoreductase [Chloroflexota bacterium]
MVVAGARQAATTSPVGDDVWIPSVCRMCNNGCGIRLHRVNGVVVQIEGNRENPHNFGRMCAKGHSAIMAHYDPNRLRHCLRRTNPRKGPGEDPGWREVSWEEATAEVVSHLRRIHAEDPRRLMFANGIAEVDMPRAVAAALSAAFGTPNFTTGVFFGTHTRASYLNNGSMHSEPDLEHCRLLVLFGSQKGGGMGHDTMKSALGLADARARGMRLVVFDPMCSAIASKADEWVPLIPGTDGAVALALLHVLLNEANLIDEPFLARETNAAYLVGESGQYVRDRASGKPLMWDGASAAAKVYDDPSVEKPALTGEFALEGEPCKPALDLLRRHVALFPPERVETISTVPAATLRRLAVEFGRTSLAGGRIVIDGVELP